MLHHMFKPFFRDGRPFFNQVIKGHCQPHILHIYALPLSLHTMLCSVIVWIKSNVCQNISYHLQSSYMDNIFIIFSLWLIFFSVSLLPSLILFLFKKGFLVHMVFIRREAGWPQLFHTV